MLFFSLYFRNIWCQICESLNVNVMSHNSCNQRSLHLKIQSMELAPPFLSSLSLTSPIPTLTLSQPSVVGTPQLYLGWRFPSWQRSKVWLGHEDHSRLVQFSPFPLPSFPLLVPSSPHYPTFSPSPSFLFLPSLSLSPLLPITTSHIP